VRKLVVFTLIALAFVLVAPLSAFAGHGGGCCYIDSGRGWYHGGYYHGGRGGYRHSYSGAAFVMGVLVGQATRPQPVYIVPQQASSCEIPGHWEQRQVWRRISPEVSVVETETFWVPPQIVPCN
jgi:hypothetical protein